MPGLNRRRRVGHAIQRELPELLRELNDPRVDDLISFSSVDVSPDLNRAVIYFTHMGDVDITESLHGLQHAAGFLRRGIARRLNSKRVPFLEFVVDELPTSTSRIDGLLRDAAEKDGRY